MRLHSQNFFLCLFLLTFPTIGLSQWFDQQSINATILLEKDQDTTIVPHGTGFLVYNYKNSDWPVVITCAHLLQRSKIYVSVNADSAMISAVQKNKARYVKINNRSWTIDNNKLRTEIKLTGNTIVTHPTLDVGAFLINLVSTLIDDSGKVVQKVTKLQAIPLSAIRKRKDVYLGDELYFVGFPFGIGTDKRIEPLIRSGSVAWMSQDSPEFLIDAFSFGGNSGSPIFSKVIIGRKRGTLSWDAPYLVGMVIGHFGQDLQGVLTQPDPQKALFERNRIVNNFGLARCIWIDDILSIIDKVVEKQNTK